MRWLVLEKLAPCLRVRVSANTPTPTVVSSCRQDNFNNDAGDFQQDEQQPQDNKFMTIGTTDKLLTEIRDMLQSTIRSKAEDSDKSDDVENKNNWKSAAAVIDRILLIIFSTLLIGGTIIFFIIFAVGYRPHS